MSQSKSAAPRLSCDSYVALALQPKVYGCRNRDDMKKNMDNQLKLIVNITLPEPMVMMDAWEFLNRSRAFDNACYLVCPNSGPYYMTPNEDAQFSLLGGKTMVVDYRGNNSCKVAHQDETSVPCQINIKALREYRMTSPHAGHIGQMRSGLFKRIYEKWPDFPKNRYVERTYNTILDRHVLLLEHLNTFFNEEIWTRPE